MKFKQLFNLPEIFLLFSLLLGPAYVGHSALDIQVHDTLYVIEGGSWWNNGYLILFPQNLFVIISWIFHVVLRRNNLLSGPWKWAQVILTVSSQLLILLIILLSPLPRRYLDFQSFNAFQSRNEKIVLCFLLCVICQVIFWIAAIILLVRNTSSSAAKG